MAHADNRIITEKNTRRKGKCRSMRPKKKGDVTEPAKVKAGKKKSEGKKEIPPPHPKERGKLNKIRVQTGRRKKRGVMQRVADKGHQGKRKIF